MYQHYTAHYCIKYVKLFTHSLSLYANIHITYNIDYIFWCVFLCRRAFLAETRVLCCFKRTNSMAFTTLTWLYKGTFFLFFPAVFCIFSTIFGFTPMLTKVISFFFIFMGHCLFTLMLTWFYFLVKSLIYTLSNVC